MSNEYDQFRGHTSTPESDYIFEQRDERGFIQLLFAAKALGTLRKMASSKGVWAGIAVAGITVGPVANGIGRNTGVDLSTDLNAAKTTSKTEILDMNLKVPLTVADMYFKTQLDVRDIDQDMTVSVPLAFGKKVSKTVDYQYNTRLTGIGEVNIKLDHSSITAEPGLEGKTDFIVDTEKLLVNGHWTGGSPQFEDYTLDNGKPNFKDKTEIKNSYVNLLSKISALANINFSENYITDLKSSTEHDINLLALESVVKNCPQQMTDDIQVAIKNAIETNVQTFDQDGEVGEIRYEGTPKFTVEKPPKPVATVLEKEEKLSTKYTFDAPTVDEISCGPEPLELQTPAPVGQN